MDGPAGSMENSASPHLQTSYSLQMEMEINAGDCPREGFMVLVSSGSDKD